VAEANMKFDKELCLEQGENLVNAIMDKYKLRCEILRQHCEALNPLVKASLINFPAFLRQY
jgi:hypothetical protein